LYGGHSQLKLSGKGQGKLQLSGNGNECKPLLTGDAQFLEVRAALTRPCPCAHLSGHRSHMWEDMDSCGSTHVVAGVSLNSETTQVV
jgi:hypothetical protein